MDPFIEVYQQYVLNVLRPTHQELRELFLLWRTPDYWGAYAKEQHMPTPSPIQRAHARIKRPESVVDKILRKPASYEGGIGLESVQSMKDAVGGRLIVYFLSQLPIVDRAIQESDILEVSQEDPPVAYLSQELIERLGLSHLRVVRKDSGYASLHYIVRLRKSSVAPENRPWFEIQVRTLAEDVWGEVEHVLGYKPGKRTSFAVRQQFRIIASLLTAIDEHFNLLHEELSRYQQFVHFRDADPLNAENLPAVLNDLGIGCAQKEIDGLLKLLSSRGIVTVGILRATKDTRVETVRNVYLHSEGRAPNHFEVVAGLAAAQGHNSPEEVSNAIKSQIELLKAWEELKGMSPK